MPHFGRKIRINECENVYCPTDGKTKRKQECLSCDEIFGTYDRYILCKRGMGKGLVSAKTLRKRRGQ